VGAAWLYGERLQPAQWIGAALVVLSVGVISIRAARPTMPVDARLLESRAR
jgi:drug/metabolite transporter (DMT)-like permease